MCFMMIFSIKYGLKSQEFCCCQNRDEQCESQSNLFQVWLLFPVLKSFQKWATGVDMSVILRKQLDPTPGGRDLKASGLLSTEGGPHPPHSSQCTQRSGLHLEGSPDLTVPSALSSFSQAANLPLRPSELRQSPSKSCQDSCLFLPVLASVFSGNLIYTQMGEGKIGGGEGRDRALHQGIKSVPPPQGLNGTSLRRSENILKK